MFKIQTIDEYSPLGNSLQTINQNFSILDTRNCVYDADREKYDGFFSQIESLSSKFFQFNTKNQELSSTFRDTANLVHSLQDYWLNSITLVYPRTFVQIANYQEIVTWLDTNFSTLAKNQVVKVQFVVKTFDDILLTNSQLDKISVETLDALANTYNIKTIDIQNYIVLDNHVKTVIATISNILTRLLIKLELKTYTDLDTLSNSFSIKRGILSSNILTTLSYTNLLLIWSFLLQYNLIRQRYIDLSTLGISAIRSNVISKFNSKNIYESFIGEFCFKNNGTTWEFLPSCDRDVCLLDQCDDCYAPVDVNILYDSNECGVITKYVLSECQAVAKEPTKHIFQTSQVFTIPDGAILMKVKAWGEKGGADHSPESPDGDVYIKGGGGGYSYAEYDVIEGTQLYIACKEFKGIGITNRVAFGGGLCGVFLGTSAPSKYSYDRALIIAGGGGGAVADEDGLPSGQFLPGLPGNSTPSNSGGMSSMQGVAGSGTPNNNNEIGSGGGGYRGGSARKGGTGFINSSGSNSVYTAGIGTTTANTGDPDYALLTTGSGVIIEIEYSTNYIIE